MNARRGSVRLGVAALFVAALPTVRAEVVEEIVAWVNGEIITRSQFDEEERQMIAEAYRRYSGAELDERVKGLSETLLMDMIDRRILLDRARVIFTDLTQIRDYYYRAFKESQNVTDEEDFSRALAQEGMTVEQFKNRLLELYAPDEVLRMEVRDRIAVSDAEVEAYYREHPESFVVPDEITIREIVLKAATAEERERRRAEARTIVEEIRAGADFAETARRVSEAGTKDEGGLLGPLAKGELSPALEEQALALPVGSVSDALEMSYGFHVLKVESRRIDATKSLEEVRDQVRSNIEERKFLDARREFVEKMRDEAEWCVKDKYRDKVDPQMLRTMRCESS